jgi:hypothetical protein
VADREEIGDTAVVIADRIRVSSLSIFAAFEDVCRESAFTDIHMSVGDNNGELTGSVRVKILPIHFA